MKKYKYLRHVHVSQYFVKFNIILNCLMKKFFFFFYFSPI